MQTCFCTSSCSGLPLERGQSDLAVVALVESNRKSLSRASSNISRSSSTSKKVAVAEQNRKNKDDPSRTYFGRHVGGAMTVETMETTAAKQSTPKSPHSNTNQDDATNKTMF